VTKSTRHLVNALVLLVIGAHAIYWFAAGNAERATDLVVGLRGAQGVLGFAGALWFYVRARRTAV
jgi:hypothetical protein